MVNDMTVGNPTKLIVAFAIPMLIGNIFQQFYSMVDAVIVGRYISVAALAAVGATGAMSFLVLGFVLGLTTGFSIIISQRFGSSDAEGLRKAVAMSGILSIFATIILTIIALATTMPLLTYMNTPPEIIQDANAYITVVYAGLGATLFYNLFSSILRALGDSKTPLYFLIASSVINVVLDLLFVAVFDMGVRGAAFATVFSQGISAILCFIYIVKKFPILRLSVVDWKWDGSMILKLLRIGVPTALQSSVTAIGVMVIQTAVNALGYSTVAAYTAAAKIEQLAIQPSVTFGFAMATYGAQNLGAGNIPRVKDGLRKCLKLALIFSVVGGLAIVIFGGWLTRLFMSPDVVEVQKVVSESRLYLNIVAAFFPVLGTLFVYRSALQGLGNATIPLISGLVELVMRVAIAMILSNAIGYVGICLASPFAWIGAAALLVVAYYINIKKLDKRFSS